MVAEHVKHRPHQQQCRSNIVECYKSNDSFDKVECCFDIVAVFGNNVAGFGNNIERNFVLPTKSKQTEHVQCVLTLSKRQNFVLHCCRNRQRCCCRKRQQCRNNIRLCRKDEILQQTRSTLLPFLEKKVECCFEKVERRFDIVAGVDGQFAANSKAHSGHFNLVHVSEGRSFLAE